MASSVEDKENFDGGSSVTGMLLASSFAYSNTCWYTKKNK